jgi:eukaryotic-like serine/threonine-protein kinase
MTPWNGEQWKAAAAELDALLDLDPEAREAAMAALFKRDAGLATDVARLLADLRSAHAERFLDAQAPALVTAPTEPVPAGGAAAGGLPAGTQYGGCRIGSVLGRGGMGVVYAAEEIDSGRRVALKVLAERIVDPRQRERFAREGRLAAAIDHPHCVFVFGADEVEGIPFIAMELMQGTLAERIAASGALPPAAAVDAALQLIAGLEAAARVGVLHRDVKPSNCFVDAEGAIKIGDFGISRSLRATDETTKASRGLISATPMYASPEQLRGDAVDVRSDIYSLGATLYELVTGRRPFDADDLMTLLMRVASEMPTAPHVADPTIPKGLSDVILRCLAKRPEQRFASHEALAAALVPYGSAAPTPATLGRRLLAGAIDGVVVSTISLVVLLAVTLPLLQTVPMPLLLRLAIVNLPIALYFGTTESLWSRSPGKAICRLTVVDTRGRPVRGWRTWIRAACFAAMWAAIGSTYAWATVNPREALRQGPLWRQVRDYGVYPVFLGLVFASARRRNGYAALQDLATGTRVVAARQRVPSTGRTIDASSPPAGRVVARHGAFAVYDAPIDGLDGWHAGYDERLRRQVWIRDVPPGAPPIPAHRAAISRPTRLRWLAGRRGDDRAWDVYEGAAGRSLARACATPRTWREVHAWLLDVAEEVAAHGPEDRPPLRIDRVWILESGRAKLLDDPTVDARSDTDPPSVTPAELLQQVAQLTRRTMAEPWPVEAGRFVETLASPDPPPADDIGPTLRAIGGATQVTTRWRALSIGGQLALPLVLVGGPLLTQLTMPIGPPIRESPHSAMFRLVDALDEADRRGVAMPRADREAIELVLASRYRMAGSVARVPDEPDGRRRARIEAIARRHPTDAGVAGAVERPAVRRLLEIRPHPPLPSVLFTAMLLYDALAKVALCAMVSAVVARGALLRLLGFEVVTVDGPASRLRVTVRTAIAWAAVLGPAIPFAASGDWFVNIATNIPVAYVAFLVQLGGAAVAIAHPSRGLQDRLAGTWIVPR